MEDIKKQKIQVKCHNCDKNFTTTIGWALSNNGNLICRKCYDTKNIESANMKTLNEAIEKLKSLGMNFELI